VKLESVDRVVVEIHLVALVVSATSLKRSLVEGRPLVVANVGQAVRHVDKTLKRLQILPLKKQCLVARQR
jgi:hypothetical protein